jgi:hypothetical protein
MQRGISYLLCEQYAKIDLLWMLRRVKKFLFITLETYLK